MKYLLLISCLVAATFCYGQDCKDIVKKVDEMRGETTFISPVLPGAPRIVISKAIVEGQGKATALAFANVGSQSWKSDPKGLFIKFDDGSILRFPTAPIAVKNIGVVAGVDSYFAVTTIILNRDNIDKFTEHKIVQYKMEYIDCFVEPEWGEKVMNWITCVYNSK